MRDRLRSLAEVLVFSFVLLVALVVRADAQVVAAIDSVGITVDDLEHSSAFYREVLGFERVGRREETGAAHERLYGVFGARVRIERLRLGREQIELVEFLAPRGRPIPVDSRSNDGWFQHVAIIVSDIDRAYLHLRQHGVTHASTGPQRLPDWNPDAGGISAFYFRDPDGHHLEILQFPPGRGDPRWQGHDGRLFLGIDHTAIVVADTAASLRYYRDALGLQVAGTSENHGLEQERLNNVFGARLRITALRAARGFGVELLEYLAPRSGRPMPLDTQANDLWHWSINARGDVAAAERASRDGHYAWVSPGVLTLPDAGGTALHLRDPDGHALLIRTADPGIE